jgi:PAS domain S-box-containing protein
MPEMADTSDKIIDELALRLAEAEATLGAIRDGSVDAIVVCGGEGQQVYTLESVDLPYRQFLERMGEGALSLDSSARIIYCNRFFTELVGVSRADVLGAALESFIAPACSAVYRDALDSREPQRISSAISSANGQLVPVQISLTSTGSGDARRWVVVISDLSGAERLSAVSAAHEAAEAASLAKDQFLALVGHELRTPLAVMLGWTEYLLQQRQPDEAKTNKALVTIKRNAQLQQKLIEDLLDVSRIVSGKLDIERRELDLSSLVKDVAGALALRADAAGVELRTELGEPALVRGDPQRLEQVLSNVVGNAIKFTPRGGRVAISVTADHERACIEVADTGVGIDAATLPRIFQLFRQGGGKRQRESGLGLGLTITKHLVELHEGSVHVRSDGPGFGSTFTIVLPALSLAPALLGPSSHPPAAPAPDRLPPSRVLVVDDQQEMREVTVRLLRSFGAEVVDVIDATSALAWLEKEQFDLVVSDIMMPGVDGMEFARALRERHGAQRPLLALTALSGGPAQEQARLAGFSAFLTKPVTRNLLYRTVNDLLATA